MEEQGRSLVIKIDREAVMKIAVNGDLFTLRKGMHELNLTVGGVPFREAGLLSKVSVDQGGLVYTVKQASLCPQSPWKRHVNWRGGDVILDPDPE